MESLTISFIGAGNMAASIIGGLVAEGCDPGRIRASDPDAEALEALAGRYGIRACGSNPEAVAGAQTVILAVKPQVMSPVVREIAAAVAAEKAVAVSIAAGITIASLEGGLGKEAAIVRCMPNTPALLGQGATALFANPRATATQREQAQTVLGAVGEVCWVPEEKQLDAVTALSGSGPAYFFLLLEAMMAAGEALGLSPDISRRLSLQTGLGATRMAAETEAETAELRRRVTSPGGTTERALAAFEAAGFREAVLGAMQAAAHRAEELGREAKL